MISIYTACRVSFRLNNFHVNSTNKACGLHEIENNIRVCVITLNTGNICLSQKSLCGTSKWQKKQKTFRRMMAPMLQRMEV